MFSAIMKVEICVTEKICVTGELRSVINLWLDDYGHSSYQKVNVGFRLHFELKERFGLILC